MHGRSRSHKGCGSDSQGEHVPPGEFETCLRSGGALLHEDRREFPLLLRLRSCGSTMEGHDGNLTEFEVSEHVEAVEDQPNHPSQHDVGADPGREEGTRDESKTLKHETTGEVRRMSGISMQPSMPA